MNEYSTELLLNLLSRLKLVQKGAEVAKQLSEEDWKVVSIGLSPTFLKKWFLNSGICENVLVVGKKEPSVVQTHLNHLLKSLFRKCPSGTGTGGLPVQPVDTPEGRVGYGQSKQTMWGNHPYADNRRQIISECIDQLHTELQKRGINVG